MKNSLASLSFIHLELTNRCNKSCWMCGRRKIERDYPDLALQYDDIDYFLAKKIAKQLPINIVVQFHNNGEPLLYPFFGKIVKLFKKQIKCVDSNGKLLLEKSKEIIDILDTLTISVIENDPEGDEQYEMVKKFLEIKKDRKPFMIYRLLGNLSYYEKTGSSEYPIEITIKKDRWYKLVEQYKGLIATRTLHNPLGSYNYEKKVTIPEIGICLEVINHLAINTKGEVSICVRFDPKRELVIGNLREEKLVDIWNSPKRLEYLKKHIEGKREELVFCNKCEYFGVPIG